MNTSMWRASLAGIQSSTLKPFTSPAKRQEKLDASKRVMGAMPVRPPTMFAQPSSTELPTGQTSPRPVTTTRRRSIETCVGERWPSGRLLVLGGVVDRQLHRGDLLGFLVWNLDAELVLERHHELHRVERIR